MELQTPAPTPSPRSDFLENHDARRLVEGTPLRLDGRKRSDVAIFRRILELAVLEGRWAGSSALPS